MMDTNTTTLFEFFEDAKKVLQDYVNIQIKIFKLELIKKNATIGGLLLWMLIFVFLFFGLLLFAGFAFSFWMGALLQNIPAGFAITTIIFSILIVLITLFRKQLCINPFIKIIIQQQTIDLDD
ncbi:MAG: hypothetical protein GTN67_15030 [Hydrotalea flava]|uniref:hypothetical protein n=2 Tax=Chitinophagaceae TaxID=563835 RepID=UPI000942154C|nr:MULTISPECIES: hypothetical protein [unclassified Hydrotalea]NIM36584.1 hypothetical protein [Hydrotalea flava]NIM39444.1 hypothetical protein [Hydrotalea flava]NIN04633.1 hypothetical protein [Hydrotalea flava]NIN16305.1 hypothetical protein [Hydrotalea flava]NIO95370.1 hypothetical protein [Hydrotalea flava]